MSDLNDDLKNEQQNSDDEHKLTRRLFVQYSAAMAATSSVIGGIVYKTDALASQPLTVPFNGDNGTIYSYLP